MRLKFLSPGRYHSVWTGTDESGRTAPSGVYLIRLRVNDAIVTGKAMLLK